MIRINKRDCVDMKWIEEKHYKFIDKRIITDGKLKKLIGEFKDPKCKEFLKYFRENKREIVIGNCDVLNEITQKIEKDFGRYIFEQKSNTEKTLGDRLKEFYDDFNSYNIYEEVIESISTKRRNLIKNINCGKYEDMCKIKDSIGKYLRKTLGSNLKDFEEEFYVNIDNDYILNRFDDYKEEIPYGGTIEKMKGAVRIFEAETINFIKQKRNEIYNSYFLYKSSDKDHFLWGAYPLVMELKVDVCPYCNRQYINTYYSEDGKIRAHLDHFMSKSKYPYLSVSLYNLIPSCYSCNSNLKNDKEFHYDTHINPYTEGFEDDYLFSVTFNKKYDSKEWDLSFLYGSSQNFRIKLKEKSGKVNVDKSKRIENSIKAFKIEELYNFHKDYIQEIIKKSIMYSESRINELFTQYNGTLFSSREDVISCILSNYINTKDFDKRILAKLTRDISKEFKLLNENKLS